MTAAIVIGSVAFLTVAFTVGMVFGVGMYRAGQLRAQEVAREYLQTLNEFVAQLVTNNVGLQLEISDLEEQIEAWNYNHGVDRARRVDMPSRPLTPDEELAFDQIHFEEEER